jgi:hypothetical protein
VSLLSPRQPVPSVIGRRYLTRPSQADHPLPKVAHPLQVAPPAAVPDKVDLRPWLTPIRDQGSEGSCFSFAGAALKEFNCSQYAKLEGPVAWWLSPAYLAWRVRVAEGTFPQDAGASIADTMAVLQSWGVCPESFLPFAMNPAQAGNAACDVAARPYRIGTPCVVDFSNPDNLKRVLAANKVVPLGFDCTQSFEQTGSDGVVKQPDPNEGSVGGHAVLACGYDADGVYIRNSWGQGWAKDGYAQMPWSYLSEWFEAWATA